ncbi:MAG: hypothetical protein QNL61_10565 [Crocinitomicaceae bacterium]
MKIGILTSLFFISTVKFMFAPLGGPHLNLTFIETYLACCGGAIFSAAIFYFSAEFFLIRALKKRYKVNEKAKKEGIVIPRKKSFTRTNKLIVRIKKSMGIIGTCFWIPFFLSIPLGSIVAAKFYGKKKKTFPLILVGIFINAFVTTTISYSIYQ